MVLLLKPYWMSTQNPKKLAAFAYVFIVAGSCITNLTGYRLVTGDYCDHVVTNLLFSQWGIDEVLPDSKTQNYVESLIIMFIAIVLHVISAGLIWKKKVLDKLANRVEEDRGVILNCLVIPIINMPMILPEIQKETVPERSKDRGVIMNSLIIPVCKIMSEIYEAVSEAPGMRSHKDDADFKNSEKDRVDPVHNETNQSLNIPTFIIQQVSEEVDISNQEALETDNKEVPMPVIEAPDIKSQEEDDDLKNSEGDGIATVNDFTILTMSISVNNIKQASQEVKISNQVGGNILGLYEYDGTVSEEGDASSDNVTPDVISISTSENFIHNSATNGETGPQ